MEIFLYFYSENLSAEYIKSKDVYKKSSKQYNEKYVSNLSDLLTAVATLSNPCELFYFNFLQILPLIIGIY